MTVEILADLQSICVPINDVSIMVGNPRLGDVEAIKRAIDRFGVHKPVVCSRDGTVLAGNHTVRAIRELGGDVVPVVWVDDDEATARARSLSDNRVGDLGLGYDEALLADLIASVADDADLLASTGYDLRDLEALAGVPEPPEDVDDQDDVPSVPSRPVTSPGDIWLVGPHRVVCGDCRDAEVVGRLLAGAEINVAVTSPPYADRRDYDPTSGFVPIKPDEYVEWFEAVAHNVADNLAEDGSWFVNIKPGAEGLDTDLYVHDLVAAHVREWGWHFCTEFCWERNGVPKQPAMRFKNQFEPVYQFAKGRWKMRPDNVRHRSENAIMSLGPGSGNTSWKDRQGDSGVIPANRRKRKHSTTKSNADSQGQNWEPGEATGDGWAYPGNRLPTFIATHEATGHTAAFPVGLPEWFIKAYSDSEDVVYDPFTGSGSTLLAANNAGRIFYGAEISPGYVDVTLKRWQRHTGILPVLESTGESRDFDAQTSSLR